jgi:hypothetical protein
MIGGGGSGLDPARFGASSAGSDARAGESG